MTEINKGAQFQCVWGRMLNTQLQTKSGKSLISWNQSQRRSTNTALCCRRMKEFVLPPSTGAWEAICMTSNWKAEKCKLTHAMFSLTEDKLCTSSGAAHSHGPTGEKCQWAQVYGALQFQVSLSLSLPHPPPSLTLYFPDWHCVFVLPSPNIHESTALFRCFGFPTSSSLCARCHCISSSSGVTSTLFTSARSSAAVQVQCL